MTLTELRYIVAVTKEKHLGLASQFFFLSQSTLKASQVFSIHQRKVVVR